jgi:hypothetical protein
VRRSPGIPAPRRLRWAPQSPSCRRSPSPRTQSAAMKHSQQQDE